MYITRFQVYGWRVIPAIPWLNTSAIYRRWMREVYAECTTYHKSDRRISVCVSSYGPAVDKYITKRSVGVRISVGQACKDCADRTKIVTIWSCKFSACVVKTIRWSDVCIVSTCNARNTWTWKRCDIFRVLLKSMNIALITYYIGQKPHYLLCSWAQNRTRSAVGGRCVIEI